MKYLFTYGPVPVKEAEKVKLKETEVGEIPEDWDVVKLGEVASVDWGNTSLTKSVYQPIGFPAFSATGQDGYCDFYEHEGKAVIVSAIGARCGKCFYAEGKWVAIKNTIVVKPIESKIEAKFLYYYLDDERRWPRGGSGQPFIAIGKAKMVAIPLPPLETQQKIASILSAVDEKIQAEENKKKALEDLFKTLLHDLMTAKIRVHHLEVEA